MKFVELSKSLRNNIDKCYFINGEDAFLRAQAVKLICNYCGRELEELNYSVFDDENFDIEKINESASMPPMVNPKRVIILKNLEKISDKDKSELQKIINNLSNDVCFIVNCNFTQFDNTTLVDCSCLDDITLKKYIVRELQNFGKQITQDALELLIEYKSRNLTNLTTEILKICNYSEETTITTEAIKNLITPEQEFQIYELTEALGNKNREKTLDVLNYLLKMNNSNLLSLISNHFRRVAFASLSDYTNDELAEMFNVKPYAIIKARNQSRAFSKIQLKNILETLENVDFMIKSGKMQLENALYYLIFKILYC